MDRISKIKGSLTDWNKDEAEDLIGDELLKGKPVFSEETFSVTFTVDPDFDEDGGHNCSLMIPDSYPRGTYTLLYGSNMHEYKGENMFIVMDKVMKRFKKMREKAMKELVTPTPMDGEDVDEHDVFLQHMQGSDEEEGESGEEFDEDGNIPITPDEFTGFGRRQDDPEAKANFEKLVDEVNKHNKKGLYVKKGASGLDNFRIYLLLDPKKRLNISDLVANCWGIDLKKYIVISLTISSYNLFGCIVPEISSFQAGEVWTDPNAHPTAMGEEKLKYGLGWTVSDRLLKDFFKKTELTRFGRITNGKNKGKNFMIEALEFVQRTLKSSPYYCVVCGTGMQHVGIKPSVCSSPLCVFSHEEYGLGCDLESEIVKNTEVVDMLITMTVAAASSPTNKGFNPFVPFPYGVESKTKDAKTGEIIKQNFLTSQGEKDNRKVLDVVSKVPPLKKLKIFVANQNLKQELDRIDPRMYALLRWIISSNRCHLHRLQKNNQIKNMKTDHQYIMMSGTAEKEAQFLQLKEQYGSIQAWHGSPLYNWHAILRLGLKNMSGKKGQLHGAAYGSGVYFAKDSRTSCSYMKFHSGWVNSMFNNSSLGMLALCEIINHPNYKAMPNPFYVIPDEAHIQTRLFFVYPQYTQVNCTGKSVKIPKIRWNSK